MMIEKELEKLITFLPEESQNIFHRYNRTMDVLVKEPQPEVGFTPKEAIWTKNKATLYRYISDKPKKHKTPLLMIYALINKSYILDITKGFSLIEYLLDEGFDVYLLDWGTPGLEDRNMRLDDYILDYIPRAVKKVLRTSKASDLSILGYCMGGTMTAIFASLHPELPIKNLVFLTSPFDFENTGQYGRMLDDHYFDVSKVIETYGNIPPEMIDFGNKMVDPVTNFIGPYKTLYERADKQYFIDSWKLMQKWVGDGVPFTGEAFRQWISEFYQENKLINGELVIRGRKVDLSAIEASVLSISGERDQIAQPHMVEPLMNVIPTKDKKYVCMPTGHVSVVFGPKGVSMTFPCIADWLAERSN